MNNFKLVYLVIVGFAFCDFDSSLENPDIKFKEFNWSAGPVDDGEIIEAGRRRGKGQRGRRKGGFGLR